MIRIAIAPAILFAMISSVCAQFARMEIYSLPSVTLADSDFLAGRLAGQPVNLAGELRIPKPGNEKLPAVVLLHGSGGLGGIGGTNDEWKRELNQLGIATFTIDSFAGRGIVSTGADQFQLGRLNMVVDAYRALERLARHPRIDPSRIAVMGFSRGAQSALYSAMNRLYDLAGLPENLRFAVHIAFYPDCTTVYRADVNVVEKPIRILHGTSDNLNPVAPCRNYVSRLVMAQKNIQLIEYADASHGFDAPTYRTPIAGGMTMRRCQLEESEDSKIVNRETQIVFTSSDPCIERGGTLSYNEAASIQARVFVRGFFTELFKLNP